MELYGRMFSYLAYMRPWLEFLVPKAEKEKEGGRGKKIRGEERKRGNRMREEGRGEKGKKKREDLWGTSKLEKYLNWTASWLLWEKKIP